MKTFKFFSCALMLTFFSIYSFAQQNSPSTVILQKSFCQNYSSLKTSSFIINFQLTGLSDQAVENFKTKALKTDGVINFSIEPSPEDYKNIKAELFQQADFDFIKNLFQENGIQNINEEDVSVSVEKWKPFTSEQCQKISLLNQQISSVEMKFNYIKQDPNRSQADKDAYFEKNEVTFKNLIQSRRDFINSIVLN